MSFLQNVAAVGSSGSAASSLAGSPSVATSGRGSLLMAIGTGNNAGSHGSNGSVSSVADTQSNLWVYDASANASTSSGRGMEFWRCQFPTALGLLDTITVTLQGGTTQDHGIWFIIDQFTQQLGAPDVGTGTTTYGSSGSTVSLSESQTATAGDAAAGEFYSAININGQDSSNLANGNLSISATVFATSGSNGLYGGAAYLDSPSAASHSSNFTWTHGHTVVMMLLGYPSSPTPQDIESGGGAESVPVTVHVDDAAGFP